MNKNIVKICTPRALPTGALIVLTIDKNFCAIFNFFGFSPKG
jgi:hypothetical protein